MVCMEANFTYENLRTYTRVSLSYVCRNGFRISVPFVEERCSKTRYCDRCGCVPTFHYVNTRARQRDKVGRELIEAFGMKKRVQESCVTMSSATITHFETMYLDGRMPRKQKEKTGRFCFPFSSFPFSRRTCTIEGEAPVAILRELQRMSSCATRACSVIFSNESPLASRACPCSHLPVVRQRHILRRFNDGLR